MYLRLILLLSFFLFPYVSGADLKIIGAVPFGSSSLRIETSQAIKTSDISVHKLDSSRHFIDIYGIMIFTKREYNYSNKTNIVLVQNNKDRARILINLQPNTSYEYKINNNFLYVVISDTPVNKSINPSTKLEKKKDRIQNFNLGNSESIRSVTNKNTTQKIKVPTQTNKSAQTNKPVKMVTPQKDKIQDFNLNKTPKTISPKAPPVAIKKTTQTDAISKSKDVVSKSTISPSNTDKSRKAILVSKYKPSDNQNLPSLLRRKIIILDPGHGGKDCGALSPHNNACEKLVVLRISLEAAKELDKRGYIVYLTRNTDIFIELRRRTEMANEINADLFVSVHANSIPKHSTSNAHGVETYFLSTARTERSLAVAEYENKGDVETMNFYSKSSFLNTLNSHRLLASNKLAIDLQSGILKRLQLKYKDVKDGGVREGPFWVLAGALMPSVLIEVGYMSNFKEVSRLVTNEYQKLIALGIADGVEGYIAKNR